MNEILFVVTMICCAVMWRRRTPAAGTVVLPSALSVGILADVAPDPFFSAERNGPIAFLIVLLIALVLIGVGVWRAVKRKRQQ